MGQAVSLKRARQEVRDAMGVDIVGVLNSHVDAIEDLLKALGHERQMRVQHVQLVQEQVDTLKQQVAGLQARLDVKDAQ